MRFVDNVRKYVLRIFANQHCVFEFRVKLALYFLFLRANTSSFFLNDINKIIQYFVFKIGTFYTILIVLNAYILLKNFF